MKLNKHIITVCFTVIVMIILSTNIADARTNRRVCVTHLYPKALTGYWQGTIVQLKKNRKCKGQLFITCEDFSKRVLWNTPDICFQMELGTSYYFKSSEGTHVLSKE
jgi:hypothetical protein